MSSLLFSSDFLTQDDPARLANRSQAERRVVDRGRVLEPSTAIAPSDEAPLAGSELATVVMSRTDQAPNVVVILSNPRAGLDPSPFGRAPGHRAGIDPTGTTTHFASAGATSFQRGASTVPAPQGSVAANPSSTSAAGDAPADSGIRPLMLAPSAPTVWGGGHFFASDESGGGDPGSDEAPLVWISGGGTAMTGPDTAIGVVGGSVYVEVVAPGGRQMQTVIYTISGGMVSQSYTRQQGTTIPLAGPVTHSLDNGGGDSFSFYWDATVGNHSVTVSVAYFDGSGTKSIIVDVKKPSVGFFRNDYRQLEFGSYREPSYPPELSLYGFHQGEFTTTPGALFTASVSTTGLLSGGDFAFLQKINSNWQITTTRNTNHARVSNGFVLDNTGQGEGDFLYYENMNPYTVSVPQDSLDVPIPTETENQVVPDSPHLGYGINSQAPNLITQFKSIKMDTRFETYLMFRANDGIWVSLSKLTWSNYGYKAINPANGQWEDVNLPALPGEPPPPSNPTPAQPGTVQGNNQTEFVSWTNYFDSGVPFNPVIPPLNL